MGDRHGGRFARRGRTLNPPRPQVDAHRGVGLRWREGERICAAQELAPRRKASRHGTKAKGFAHARRLSSAKASRHGARAKGFARAGTLSSAKASRHGARAKGVAPRRNAPHGEGLPTRRTGERSCPAGFAFAPRADERRAAPDRRTAGKTPLRRGRTRDRARAKGFAPRENAPHGEGIPTRICPAQKRSPRRRPPDTAHERKDLPRAETLSSAKTYRHGARAKEFARAGTRPSAKASRHGARAKGFAPRGSRSPQVPTNGGPPPTDGQPEKHPFGGVAPERARPLPSSFTEKNKTTP